MDRPEALAADARVLARPDLLTSHRYWPVGVLGSPGMVYSGDQGEPPGLVAEAAGESPALYHLAW